MFKVTDSIKLELYCKVDFPELHKDIKDCLRKSAVGAFGNLLKVGVILLRRLSNCFYTLVIKHTFYKFAKS